MNFPEISYINILESSVNKTSKKYPVISFPALYCLVERKVKSLIVALILFYKKYFFFYKVYLLIKPQKHFIHKMNWLQVIIFRTFNMWAIFMKAHFRKIIFMKLHLIYFRILL